MGRSLPDLQAVGGNWTPHNGEVLTHTRRNITFCVMFSFQIVKAKGY